MARPASSGEGSPSTIQPEPGGAEQICSARRIYATLKLVSFNRILKTPPQAAGLLVSSISSCFRQFRLLIFPALCPGNFNLQRAKTHLFLPVGTVFRAWSTLLKVIRTLERVQESGSRARGGGHASMPPAMDLETFAQRPEPNRRGAVFPPQNLEIGRSAQMQVSGEF